MIFPNHGITWRVRRSRSRSGASGSDAQRQRRQGLGGGRLEVYHLGGAWRPTPRRRLRLPSRDVEACASRYGATGPAVINEGRPYAEQVKPFNFLLTFFERHQEDLAAKDPTHEWDPKLEGVRPVAPYEKDSEEAFKRIFDRNSETLAPVPRKRLRTVANVLRDYHH